MHMDPSTRLSFLTSWANAKLRSSASRAPTMLMKDSTTKSTTSSLFIDPRVVAAAVPTLLKTLTVGLLTVGLLTIAGPADGETAEEQARSWERGYTADSRQSATKMATGGQGRNRVVARNLGMVRATFSRPITSHPIVR